MLTDSSGTFPARVEKIEVFPPAHACRVVALATLDVEMCADKSLPRYRFVAGSTVAKWRCPEDESSILWAFHHSMTESDLSCPTLVTWNGRTFDLPVLAMRSLKWGVPFGWYYRSKDVRYRYSDAGHLDLMDYLSDFGASRCAKLGEVARLVGLPGKVGPVRGDSVSEEVAAYVSENQAQYETRARGVARYCLQDVLQTALVWLRTRYHVGRIDRDEYHRSLETFSSSPDVRAMLEVDWDRVRIP